MGLRANGTVVKCNNRKKDVNIESWKNIVAISSSNFVSVGLKDDGTVVAKFRLPYDDEVIDWKNIAAIAGWSRTIVGLRSDGTLLTTSKYYREELSHWKDIMPVSTAKTFEEDRQQKIEIIRANHSKIAERQEEERLAEEKRKEEERQEIERCKEEIEKRTRRSQGVCQYCGGAFKGLFSKKCSACGRPKDY